MFLVLPSERIRLGASQLRGLVGTYSYAASVPLPDPEGFTVKDVYRPGVVHLEWANPDVTGGGNNFHYQVRRVNPGTGATILLEETTHNYWVEEHDFASTTVFEYWVRLVPDDPSGNGLPTAPPDADPADIFYYPSNGNWAKLRFHIEETVATENQTVDSRYDLRFGNPTFLDFKFGSRTYRGGLYAGFANDPSRVARSFLKFQVPAGIEDAVYFTGSVNAFNTELLNDQGVEVGCDVVSGPAWSAATLKWTTAPAFDPSSATQRFTFDQEGIWGHWKLGDAIIPAQGASEPLCFGLGSTTEGAAGKWAYLAKKEYNAALAPRLTVAAHYPGGAPAPANLQVADVGSTAVDLTWTLVAEFGTHKVQQRTPGGSWADAQVMWSGPDAVQVTGLQPGTGYQFRVQIDTGTYGIYNSQPVGATTDP